MAKHTIVALYQVDESGATGPRMGAGSLIAPLWVLVHPPLSDDIAAGNGPERWRVGLRSDPATGALVEVIDGLGNPRVIGQEAVGPLVALKLAAEAASPIDRMKGMTRTRAMKELVELAVPVLDSDDPDEWNRGDPRIRNVFLCQVFGIGC